jgi:hypothetical protein
MRPAMHFPFPSLVLTGTQRPLNFPVYTFLINPLKPKLVYTIFKNSVCTAKKKTALHHYEHQLVKAV